MVSITKFKKKFFFNKKAANLLEGAVVAPRVLPVYPLCIDVDIRSALAAE